MFFPLNCRHLSTPFFPTLFSEPDKVMTVLDESLPQFKPFLAVWRPLSVIRVSKNWVLFKIRIRKSLKRTSNLNAINLSLKKLFIQFKICYNLYFKHWLKSVNNSLLHGVPQSNKYLKETHIPIVVYLYLTKFIAEMLLIEH